MSDLHRRLGLRAWAWLVLGAAGAWACNAAARAEDDRALEDQPAATSPGEQVVRLDLTARFEEQIRRELLGEWSPAGGGASPAGGGQSSAATLLATLQRIGESRVARIDATCGLSPSQRRRLQLAVASDIGRLTGEIEAARAKFMGTIVEIDRRKPGSQQPLAEFQRAMELIVQRRRALLGGDSMLAKTLPTTLDADQLARLSADTAARRARRWQAIVASLLDGIDAWLGLDQRQYDEIELLLLEKQPALRMDVAPVVNPGQQRQAEQILAMVVLSEVEAQRLQAALSERQWKTFAPWREQGEARRKYVVNLGILEPVTE